MKIFDKRKANNVVSLSELPVGSVFQIVDANETHTISKLWLKCSPILTNNYIEVFDIKEHSMDLCYATVTVIPVKAKMELGEMVLLGDLAVGRTFIYKRDIYVKLTHADMIQVFNFTKEKKDEIGDGTYVECVDGILTLADG